MSDLHCPACNAELDLSVVFASEEEHRVLARLINISIPLGNRVFGYLSLHKPPKQRLSSAKKLKLISELLPDLERQAISHKGRDWAAPLGLWAQAFDSMAARRATLDLPLKGHGYLYAMLSGLADKVEAQQEAQTEADRRTAPPAATVTVRGQVKSIADTLAGGNHNAPIPPAPPPGPRAESHTVRKMKAEIAAKKTPNSDQ